MTDGDQVPGGWIGRSMPRVEDPRLLLGRGRYIDDLSVPRMLHAALHSSPHAHARIVSVDYREAETMPGVIKIVTGQEAAALCEPLPDLGPFPEKHIWRCLAAYKVRYVGEAVAAVVAETRAQAEDASAAIIVKYEVLPAVVDMDAALHEDSALVHEALDSNRLFARHLKWGATNDEFDKADHIVRDKLRWHRSGAQPLETVGCIADYDPVSGRLRIDGNSLTFSNFLFMLAHTLKLQSHQIQVMPTPAGGSFGSKTWAVKISAIAGMLSKVCSRPVKLIEDRYNNLSNCDHHGSDRAYEAELAFTHDGTFRALRIKVTDDYGAYAQFGVGTHANALSQVVGPYRIEHVSYDLTAVLTNKCQQGACRGFGSEVHNWVLERMVDLAAAEIGMDRLAMRRKNFITRAEFPYTIPFGNEYDSGDYHAVLDKALGMIDLTAWEARKQTSDNYIGIGFCTANERSVFAGTELGLLIDTPMRVTSMPESINVTVDAHGNVHATLYSGAFTGNSAETVVVQLIAHELQLEPAQIIVNYAGSHAGFPGTGPAGSRFTVMIAGAIAGATAKIRDKACHVAAALLGCGLEDVEWCRAGVRSTKQVDVFKPLAEIAAVAHMFKHNLAIDISTGLQASEVFDHPHMTLPKGDGDDLGIFFPFVGHACHIAVVEVDAELGNVTILDYAAVHDNGTMVNPRSLEGQIRGGTVHGIGTTLMEEYVYDTVGVLQTTNYHQYLMPTAMDVPPMAIGHLETPSPFSPHGIKGGGEAGRMMAPAALSSAIDDALASFNVRVREIPATPERIVAWVLQGAR